MSKLIHTFKSSYTDSGLVEITPEIIYSNYKKNYATNIILDTNILIDIEDAYQSGIRHKKLKEAGVIDFVKIIKNRKSKNVFLAPASAYQEVPANRKKSIEKAFNLFVKDYLPSFSDDPNATKVEISEENNSDYFFEDIDPIYQSLMACSYASLIAIHIIDEFKELTELEKFQSYLKFVSDCLDLVSLKELNIARYVFAPEKGITENLRCRIVDTRKNFSKIKKNKELNGPQKIMKMALNGAMDLRIINAADIVDSTSEVSNFTEITMDVWIATSDEKLFNFCRSCPGIIKSKSGGALARLMETHQDIKGTNYWEETTSIIQENSFKRLDRIEKTPDMDRIVGIACDLDKKLKSNSIKNYFSENFLCKTDA